MASFHDDEFGDVIVRRSHLSKQVKVSVAPNGMLRVSMPTYAPLFLAKRLIGSSRSKIREMLNQQGGVVYKNEMQIGKSHHLSIIDGRTITTKKNGQTIIVTRPSGVEEDDSTLQAAIREAVIRALRKEAKSYLPRRLEFLSNLHGFRYRTVRFSHASSRWGSCSSEGVISLNITLMKLDFALIDYVLIHELAHTKHMNHSTAFWDSVGAIDNLYKIHRKKLKLETPHV